MSYSTNDTVMSNLFTFESLVLFPLNAIIESSANGNTTTLDFLNKYCFRIVNGKRIARTFTFYYDYVKGGAAQTMKVDIPIISLITMPYYTIKKANFEMGVNIISWTEKEEDLSKDIDTNKNSPQLLAMLGPYDSTTTKGSTQSVESYQYSKINTNMKVKMEVVNSDLPAGIMRLINVSSQGVDGNTAYDLRISTSLSRLIMNKNKMPLTLKLVRNNDNNIKPLTDMEVALVPLTITVNSSIRGVDPTMVFSNKISVTKGDIVGTTSYEKVQVLTDMEGVVSIELRPSGKIPDNGFVTISSPLTSNTKIYYRSKND